MSTEQTTPPPAGPVLPGSSGVAGSTAAVHQTADPVSGPLTEDPMLGSLDPVSGPLTEDPMLGSLDPLSGPLTEDPVLGSLDPVSGALRRAEDTDAAHGEDATLDPDASTSGTVGGADRHPVGSSWQAEASGELVAMSFPGARRIAGWLFWVVFPLLCIATIHASVTKAVHHLGNKPVGIRGTFVVQPRSCSQGFCSFGGLFTSDDHTIKNLPLLGDPRWHTAEVHRVTYDPRSVEVTPMPGYWDPTPWVMAVAGALSYLGIIGYFLRQRYRAGRQHRHRPSEAARDPVPTG